ncbi:MAG TPA: decarboxylase, partial [Nitrospiria bacterium]|nr:decarboxylase [Nitrospiria bacterium]
MKKTEEESVLIKRSGAAGGGDLSADSPSVDLKEFFSASEGRVDRWRGLHRLANQLAGSNASTVEPLKTKALALLSTMEPIEELCGFPGPRLMAQAHDRIRTGDWTGFLRLVQRISFALMANSYRDDPEAWKIEDEGEAYAADILPPSIGRGQNRRPYFEILMVTPGERSAWPELREVFRRLRREHDEFVYEPVIVGSLEDALLAVIFNFNLQAAVISDGFGFASQYTMPVLREILERHVPIEDGARSGDLGTTLARLVRRIRPELDLYLVTDRNVGKLAGSEEAAPIRRVFYGVEEPVEIHLSILEGVKERYTTPYFDNLKKYAQRPIGTFHALPVARGKSIFKSNWIRDMGEFYGANLFLAESSATTGGLDSLLEPTGNIKLAQDAAARALGGDRSFFVTNGTSTSNKIVHQALLKPGDIVLIDRDCHKSHHYGMVLAGAQPLYIDAYPLTQYSMYGSLAIKPIKQALLRLKAEGKLDRAKMLVLTNCTFDGHVANVKRTMLECLAIKPDLIFLWDEAWFGFARFSPFLRRRTAMGAVSDLRAMMRDAAYR